MLNYDDNPKARKDSLISNGRLAFCSATKILLAFISRAAGAAEPILHHESRPLKKRCFGCVVKFQAREANSWPRSARSNPGNRVCVLFFFLSFFLSFLFLFYLLLAFFSFTFMKLVKPVRHHTNCLKIFMTWLVQTFSRFLRAAYLSRGQRSIEYGRLFSNYKQNT